MGVNVCVMDTSPVHVSAEEHGRPQSDGVVSGRAAVLTIGVILIASFMDLLDATIVSVAAPTIEKDLGTSAAALQWTVAGYTLALGAGLITGGRIGDLFGRRRAFMIGLAGFVLASAACALVPTAGFLVGVRILQGLAAGLLVPQVFGIIRSSLAPAAMGKAFGAYGAVQGLAAISGPLLGGALVDANLFGLGWRTIFWVNVPIGLIGLLVGARILPESVSPRGARLDLTGACLASAAAVLVLFPLVQGRDWGWPVWGFAIMVLGLVTFAAVVAWEKHLAGRGGQPILDPALLTNRAFTGGLLSSLLFFGGIGSFFFLLCLYLQAGTGRSAWEAGLVTLPYAIGSLVTSGLGIQLAARAGRWILIAGSLLIAVSHAVMYLVIRDGADPGYWALALPLFIGGLGLGLAAPPLVSVILAGVPGRDAGAAGGVLSTINQLGNSTGVAIFGTYFFTIIASSFTSGETPLTGFGDALAHVLPWQVGLYVLAAMFMLMLQRPVESRLVLDVSVPGDG
jgi:EmrB/QacA subfamily drug resistance transporter